MAQFQPGKVIKTDFGTPIIIERFLASGGQGEVYLVEYEGKKKVLKWFVNYGKNPEALCQLIKKKIELGSPDSAFLWPRAITEKIDDSFGYVMDFKPEGYYSFADFELAKIEFSSFKVAIEACIKIVSAFKALHNHGYAYQDIYFGDFFINPKTGDVLILDSDEVVPYGTNTGSMGIPRYMAPEIVFKGALPNAQTDRFSLSVMLFLILCKNHPLEGKKFLVPCLTPQIAEKIYGSEALFIFDPNDDSNGPIKNLHKNAVDRWDFMPDYIKDAFCCAFSRQAILEPNERVQENDWLEVLDKFRSELETACRKEELETPKRRVLPVFYLIDTSGSMTGERIAAVNEAMFETLVELNNISAYDNSTEIQIAIMQFSSGCSWITPSSGLVGVSDVIWSDLRATGLTNLGLACAELNKKLSRREMFLEQDRGRSTYSPVIFLFCDGSPTDIWDKELGLLKNNKWFKHAKKIAIAIGDDVDKEVLSNFAGNGEAVFFANDTETLKKLIKLISIISISRCVNGLTDITDILDAIKMEAGYDSLDEEGTTLCWDDDAWDDG